MSNLTILSDAELDAVSGGDQTATGGAGGAGGSGNSGAVVSISGGRHNDIDFGRADLNVIRSPARGGNGGDGGNGVIVNRRH
jgi:hypothetical protein